MQSNNEEDLNMKNWVHILLKYSVVGVLVIVGIFMINTNANAQAKEKIVYLYNWSEYVPSGILEEFTKETGITVILSSFESNETMYSKLKAMDKGSSYDVIAPTTYFVEKMRSEGLLQALDHRKLPNLKNIDPDLLNKPYDPKNRYSVPQVFGATLIAYNKNEIAANNIHSWADLWDPKYKGKLQLNDDAREVFHIALIKLGLNPNSKNPKDLERAYIELLKLRPNILNFDSDNPTSAFISGDVNLGMLWNGSAYIARNEGIPINIIWPTEGGIFWMDTLAIPKYAKNVEGAHALVNFFLRPDVAAKVSLSIGYPSPNLTARKLLPKEMIEDTMLYPSKEILAAGQWQEDVGDIAPLYEDYYQRLKVAR